MVMKKKAVRKKKVARAPMRPKRKVARKTARTKAPRSTKAGAPSESKFVKVGEVTHYFPKVKAAAVLVLRDGFALGDSITVKGHTTDFKQVARSMQLDHVGIDRAQKGQEIGLLVKSRVRIGDTVYKI